MLPYLFVLIALQAFCLYHAYQSRTDQKWYYLIIFIPYLGCFFYLFDAFYHRRAVTPAAEVINQAVNSNYRIEQLEKDVEVTDSATNSLKLADAYLEIGRYAEAAELYNGCRDGFLADDESLKRKLLHAWYLAGQYEKCEALGLELSNTKDFRYSNERVSFAQALQKLGKTDQALIQFEDMNRSFTNYIPRLAFCQFLIAMSKLSSAKALANELATEFEAMKGPEKRLYREMISQVADLQQSLGR